MDVSRLKKGDYEYILRHPETCLSSKQGVSLFQSNVYKDSVAAVVVDDAHCILEWWVSIAMQFYVNFWHIKLVMQMFRFRSHVADSIWDLFRISSVWSFKVSYKYNI